MSASSHVPRRLTAAALVAAAVALTAGCGGTDNTTAEEPKPQGASPAATPIATAVGPRRPPQRIDPRQAAAGTVTLEEGTFTDRVKASGLRVKGGGRPRLTGRLLNLVDVSEVLALELQADFYDRSGRYLGSGKKIFGEADPFWDTPLRFKINGGHQPRPAAAAILTIPQLITE
jgi:hypothetical protein